jgi:hypothetical protein
LAAIPEGQSIDKAAQDGRERVRKQEVVEQNVNQGDPLKDEKTQDKEEIK